MDSTVEEIEARRLVQLEKQAALYGPQTEPSILIEIAELKHRRRIGTNPDRKQFVSTLDYDFLMNVISSLLIRFNTDEQKRHTRQFIHDIWMIAITILVFLTLLLQLTSR